MFNSSILDVAIGLVFCFASVALLVSAVNEAIASALKLRHKALLAGIKQLLNDPNGVGLVAKLYSHALISPLAAGSVVPAVPKILPAYIPSRAFAGALVDVIQGVPGDMASLEKAVSAIDDAQLKRLLQGFLARSEGQLDLFESHIADWFDNAMDRLSGSYKRRAQVMTFALGLLTAAAFNIDSFYVLSQLWARPSLAAAISNPGAAAMIDAAVVSSAAISGAAATGPRFRVDEWMTTLHTLPVGWDNGRPMSHPNNPYLFWIFYVFGLFVTASSAVFGAPFWFDLLQRLVQVRGTGAKPSATNSNTNR